MSKAKVEAASVGCWELTGPAGSLRFKRGDTLRAVKLYAEHFGLDPAAVEGDVRAGLIRVEEWHERSQAGGTPAVSGVDGTGNGPA